MMTRPIMHLPESETWFAASAGDAAAFDTVADALAVRWRPGQSSMARQRRTAVGSLERAQMNALATIPARAIERSSPDIPCTLGLSMLRESAPESSWAVCVDGAVIGYMGVIPAATHVVAPAPCPDLSLFHFKMVRIGLDHADAALANFRSSAVRIARCVVRPLAGGRNAASNWVRFGDCVSW